jgi:hypothetical protein
MEPANLNRLGTESEDQAKQKSQYNRWGRRNPPSTTPKKGDRSPTIEKNQRRSQGVQMKQIQDDNLRKLRTQNPPETVHGGETTQTRTGLQE